MTIFPNPAFGVRLILTGSKLKPAIPLFMAIAMLCLPATGYGEVRCADVEGDLSQTDKREYASLIAKAIGGNTSAARIAIDQAMQSGKWSAIIATPRGMERGVFFFKSVNGHPVFKEVWGGMAVPGDKPELTSWAQKLGAPAALAKCFARTMTED